MIVTVTPNTALDRIEIVPGLAPGKVLRSSELTLSAGGKGVNVARAINNLGGEVICTGFLGGYTGQQHAELVKHEGLSAVWTWIESDTRAAIVIIDESTGDTTVINEEGPRVTAADWERLMVDVLTLAENATAVCLSGSLPLGISPEAYAELVEKLNRRCKRVWVDTSGAALQAVVKACPAVVKINGLEAAGLLGWNEFQDVSTAAQAAETILTRDLSQVVVTLGRLGAISATGTGTWYACPPQIKSICPIGSGDAFLGGLVQAWVRHHTESEAIRQAVAAGSANALSVGGGKFNFHEFEAVLAQTTVKRLI